MANEICTNCGIDLPAICCRECDGCVCCLDCILKCKGDLNEDDIDKYIQEGQKQERKQCKNLDEK